MSGPAGHEDFERWLEAELHRALASAQGPRPRAADAAYRQVRGSRRRVAAMGIVAVAVIAFAVAGEGVAAMATGMPNPVDWSQRMVQVVHDCQDRADVGSCVGMLARHRGGAPTGEPGAPPPSSAEPAPASGSARPNPTQPGAVGRSVPATPPAAQGASASQPHGNANGHGDGPKHTGKPPKS
jgi:hypothetical protein